MYPNSLCKGDHNTEKQIRELFVDGGYLSIKR